MIKMTLTEELVQKALNFDPLLKAEELTGQSYETVVGLGFTLAQNSSFEKQKILEILGDTYRQMDFWAYVPIAVAEGFRLGHRTDFGSETHMILYHPDEYIILEIDSYKSKINDAKIYFNWQPDDEQIPFALPLSGHLTCPLMVKRGKYISDREWNLAKSNNEIIFSGSQQVIDGLCHSLSILRQNGTFAEWIECPLISLVKQFPHQPYQNDNERCFRSFKRFFLMPEEMQTKFKVMGTYFIQAWIKKWDKW